MLFNRVIDLMSKSNLHGVLLHTMLATVEAIIQHHNK